MFGLDTVSLCPFTVGTVIWQPQTGAWTLTACVKGTFRLQHGRDATLAEEQEPVGNDRYFADNPRASLYAASDLVPFKPRADVTLVGHAYAPGGRPVEALVAGFSVGDLSKSVGLIGDRVWTPGGDGLEPSSPVPFARMPLRCERAARGHDNAVGLDLAAPPVAGALALPNLEAMEDDSAQGRTVGFGPIPSSWPSRRAMAQGPAATWARDTAGPAPPTFDFGYFNAAPRDQQVDLLRANARISLENLHPRHARLETRVPAVRPKAFLVDARTGRANEIALRCDTIWIDTDRATLVVVWRGLTGLETGDAAELGTLVVAVETKGKEIRYKQIENLMREGALASLGTDDLATEERNPMGVRHDSVKPGGPAPPNLPARAKSERRAPSDTDRPSGPPPGPTAESPPVAPHTPGAMGTPHTPGSAYPGSVVVPAVTSTDIAASPMEDAESSTTGAGVRALEDADEGAPAPADAAPDPTDEQADGDAAPAAEPPSPVWRDVSGHQAPDSPRPAEPAGASALAPNGATKETAAAFPVERYAELSAELVEPGGTRGDVLSAYGLSEELWEDVDRRWKEALCAEATAEATSNAFEKARVAFEERLRKLGALPVADYAKLAISAERGDFARELAAHALEARDLDLLRRLWARRVASDPDSASALTEAMEAARWE